LLQLTSSNNINIDPELNMRIVAICVCYNEEKLLPFFLDYYTSFCDEIVFFDGNSTDNSINIIRSYIGKTKCNIELRINHSIGTIDYFDYGHLTDHWNWNWNTSLYYIRNYAWKNLFSKLKNDWVIVVDVDEFMYHPIGLRERLYQLKQQNITIPTIQGFDMVSDTFPRYESGKFLVDTVKSGFWSHEQTKQLIFNGLEIDDINYTPGCHYHEANGRIAVDIDTLFVDQIKKLHYRYIGYNEFIERQTQKCDNVSIYNHQRGFTGFYNARKTMSREEFDMFKQVDTYHDNVFTAISSKKPKS